MTYKEWKAFFNYDMQTIYTEDGMFKYTRQRKYDDKVDCDYIDETLVFLKGDHITTSQGVAFYGEKRILYWSQTVVKTMHFSAFSFQLLKTFHNIGCCYL